MQQEKDRIRYGKELQAAKREEDALALKRNLEARRIEKEEERRAREKIRLKLGAQHAAATLGSRHGRCCTNPAALRDVAGCCCRISACIPMWQRCFRIGAMTATKLSKHCLRRNILT